MSLIAALLPMLKGTSEFRMSLTRSGETLKLTIMPVLEGLDSDTDDEELAALQSAVALPMVLSVPVSPDADAEVVRLLGTMHEHRAPAQDALATYAEQLKKAAELAAAAAAEKTRKAAEKTASKTTGKGPAKGGAAGKEGDATSAGEIGNGGKKEEEVNPTPDLFGGDLK